MTLRLDPGTAESVAGKHDAAAEAIDAAAGSAPASVDAGYGTAYVNEIIAAVSETAGEIAVINVGVARLVRAVADSIGLTDDEVGAQFDEMKALVP